MDWVSLFSSMHAPLWSIWTLTTQMTSGTRDASCSLTNCVSTASTEESVITLRFPFKVDHSTFSPSQGYCPKSNPLLRVVVGKARHSIPFRIKGYILTTGVPNPSPPTLCLACLVFHLFFSSIEYFEVLMVPTAHGPLIISHLAGFMHLSHLPQPFQHLNAFKIKFPTVEVRGGNYT